MKQYLNLLEKIMKKGNERGDRTGTGTTSLFAEKLTFKLTDGLPMVTTKEIHLKAIIHELIWFLSGSTNIQYLVDNNVHIWDLWADDNGELGPVYGAQWRNAGGYGLGSGVDQISQLIDTIKNNPEDRRMIVDSWNVSELQYMNLPPCHMFFQVYSREMAFWELRKYYLPYMPDIADMKKQELKEYLNAGEAPTRYLDLQMYQRSADMFLGVPFNITSYAILMEMLAAQTNHVAYNYNHIFGDAHIYLNHMEQVNTQLLRHPRTLPKLVLNPDIKSIFDYTFDDIKVEGYDPHPKITALVSK